MTNRRRPTGTTIKIFLLFSIIAFLAISTVLIKEHNDKSIIAEQTTEENEERPDHPIISEEEREDFLQYVENRQSNSTSAARKGSDDISTYADGTISGKWSYKIPQTGWNGYRVDNSTYDSLRNIFYIVSYAGHIYKLELEPDIKWTLMNHKVAMKGNRAIFTGVYLEDETFRLIRSNEDQSRMEYSDDEGQTWSVASGAQISNTSSSQAFTILDDGKVRIALHTYYGEHHLYYSDDLGQSYQPTNLSLNSTKFDMRLDKPFNTNELFLWMFDKASAKVTSYKYDPGSNDYQLMGQSNDQLSGYIMEKTVSSYSGDQYHFYFSTVSSGGYDIHYSNDGLKWTTKIQNKDRRFETMSADAPNHLFSGFEDVQMSSNYGSSWSGFGHYGGWWDLQHMNTYPKAGGGHITVLGMDFGCYISETPEVKESYIWCNNEALYAMHYDAASNELYNSIYMGNQDRGTTAYNDTGDTVSTIDVSGTDVLRVAYSNNGRGVWEWFYYGTIRYRDNFASGKSQTTTYNGLGNWWAAPIIESPVKGENAIYAAFGSNLQIFKYNEASNSMSRSSHPYNFATQYASDIGGFGYSKLNRNLWYVSLNNGMFLRSEDAGVTWSRNYTSTGPRANDQAYNYTKNQAIIRASSLDENTVFWAGVGNMFLKSVDGGKSFTNLNNGLDVYRFRDFALSPDEKFVFAACGFGGAWVYSFEQNQWYRMNDDPIPSVDFTDVEFIEGKNLVRYATYGSGIIEFKLDQEFSIINSPKNLSLEVPYSKYVKLSWQDDSDNEEGFLIERSTGGEFEEIARITDNSTSFLDTTAHFESRYFYRVTSYAAYFESTHSNIVNITVPEEGKMSKSIMSIAEVSSEEVSGEYAPGRYAVDGNINTYWHTQWQNVEPTHPHHIVIDLGKPAVISGIGYQPRQDWTSLGTIKDYEFYVSNDTNDWGDAVKSGSFARDITYKEAKIVVPETGRYVKVVALSEINGEPFTSAAEIDILYYDALPEKPANLQASANGASVTLEWESSYFEAGYFIEQKINNNFISVAEVGPGVDSYVIDDLELDKKYHFRVRAFNQSGITQPTNEVEVTTSLLAASNHWKWSVYPNPASDYVSIDMPKSTSGKLRLVDLNGRLFIEKDFTNTQTLQMDIRPVPSGVYMMELYQNGEKSVRKIVIR